MADALAIVIPAFNEEASIGQVLDDLGRVCQGFVADVIVVDDGSSDGTADVARRHGATVLAHPHNLGYGASLRTGIRHATAPYVATMDADGQHTAAALASLWDARARADMVVGTRSGLLHSRAWRMPGKWLISAIARYLTRQPIPDLNSGLRIYRRDVLARYLHICPRGFSFTTTTTLAFLNRGWRVVWVPIPIAPRVGRSTVRLTTGLETIILVLRIISLFSPLRVFVPAALVLAAAGVAWAIPIALDGRGISVGAMLAIVSGMILFALGLICDQISQLRLERFE